MARRVIKPAKSVESEFEALPGIQFIPTDARKFIQVDLDYTDPELFSKKIEHLIPDVTDAVVYVSIRIGQEDLGRLDLNKIKDLTSGAYYCREIVPVIVKERSLRIKALKDAIGPTDAVQAFVKAHKPKNAKRVIAIADALIRKLGLDKEQ